MEVGPGVLIPLLFPAVAGGVGWLVRRAYARSDARRTEMIDLLKKQAAAAEESEERAWRRARKEEALKMAYWKQLVENGIEPKPPLGVIEDDE